MNELTAVVEKKEPKIYKYRSIGLEAYVFDGVRELKLELSQHQGKSLSDSETIDFLLEFYSQRQENETSPPEARGIY